MRHFLSCLAFLLASAPLAAQVALDTSFDGDGRRTVPFDLDSADTDSARRIFPTAGGGYLVVGQASNGAGIALALTRLTAAGQVDTTFGTNGKRSYPLGITAVVDAAQDSQGRLVVVGTEAVSGGSDVFVTRILANGEIDAGFGFLGLSRINVQAEDDVLAVTTGPQDQVLALVRTRPSPSFAWVATVAALDINGQNQRAVDLSALPDAGSGALAWSSGRNALAVGLTFAGSANCVLRTLDVTLSGSGANLQLASDAVAAIALTTTTSCTQVRINSLAAVPGGGAVVMAGHRENPNAPGTGRQVGLLVRFAAGGPGVDPGFNNGSSRIEQPPFPATDLLFESAAVDAGGGILLAANIQNSAGPTSSFAVWRYLPTGVPDVAFNGGSPFLRFSFPNNTGADSALAVVRDLRLVGARILMAGRSRWVGTTDDDFAVAALALPGDALFDDGFEP